MAKRFKKDNKNQNLIQFNTKDAQKVIETYPKNRIVYYYLLEVTKIRIKNV